LKFEIFGIKTVLLTMVVFKIRKNWSLAGPTPLLQVLLRHGAAYYFVLALAFALQILASMTDEVGAHHPVTFNRPLPVGYSFTMPWWTPSMWRCLSIAQYLDRTNSFAVSVGVVACNHLMLSLKEALDRPVLTEPPTSFSRHTTGVAFVAQASNATSSYADELQTISLTKSPDRDHKQRNQGRKLGTWNEMRPYRG
jgi:hypothetical protein